MSPFSYTNTSTFVQIHACFLAYINFTQKKHLCLEAFMQVPSPKRRNDLPLGLEIEAKSPGNPGNPRKRYLFG